MKITCTLCFHNCKLGEGQTGFCGARSNRGGEIRSDNYGKITSIALDPIEKKPLYHFYPGSSILSVGSFGCNLRCPFCQNHEISFAKEDIPFTDLSPEALVREALALRARSNIGIAFTYNEPLIGIEYLLDTAKLAKQSSLMTVLVTNGTVSEDPLRTLLSHIDAMNIDLKGFTQAFYRSLSGDLASVKTTIQSAARSCHVEVTTLIIPGKNDSDEEMEALSGWRASVDPSIPYHISRYFPRHLFRDVPATPISTIRRLTAIAGRHLSSVYAGNCT